MRILLDTHTWLWILGAPKRLSRNAAALAANPDNELWLSPASVWEAFNLAERGRVAFHDNPRDWIRRSLRDSRLREAPLTHEVIIESRGMLAFHHDPIDRFIAATAVVHKLTLLTSDQVLLNAGICETYPAR